MRVRVVTVVQFSERSCEVTMQAADVLVTSECLLFLSTVLPYSVPSWTERMKWMIPRKLCWSKVGAIRIVVQKNKRNGQEHV